MQAYEKGKGTPPQTAKDVADHVFDREDREEFQLVQVPSRGRCRKIRDMLVGYVDAIWVMALAAKRDRYIQSAEDTHSRNYRETTALYSCSLCDGPIAK